jgi:hypothetical protein
MAVTKGNWFPFGGQAARFGFLSIARSAPLRAAHSPPSFCPLSLRVIPHGVLDCIEEPLADAPNQRRKLRPLRRGRDVYSWRKRICTNQFSP